MGHQNEVDICCPQRAGPIERGLTRVLYLLRVPIVAVRKGNEEGADFGRKCSVCKFHPETEGNGESCCPCQS